MTNKTNQVATTTENSIMMPFSSVANFETAQRMAQVLTTSDLVPDTYKGKIGNAVIALEMANRLGASPLMVMQNLYIVHGQPSWSSKFLVACFNTCGRFTPISYEENLSIEPDHTKWFCRAKATSKETGEVLTGTTITWEMVEHEGWSKKPGSKWLTMPAQMFRYRAAAFFVRSVAPEISFGFQTSDEVADGVNNVVDLGVVETEDPIKAEMERIEATANEIKVEAPMAEPQPKAKKVEANNEAQAKASIDAAKNLFNNVDL